jgi:matrixin
MNARTGYTVVGMMLGATLSLVGPPALPADAGQRPFGRPFGRLDTTRPITYYIADGTGEAGYRRSDLELAQWAFEAWARIAATPFRLEPAAESSALVRLYWAAPRGTQLGEMRPLTVEGRRGAAVYIRPDLNAFGETIARRAAADFLLRESIVYLTCLHELGHAFGLAHSRDFDDIMYSLRYGGDTLRYFGRYREQLRTRNDLLDAEWLSESDVRRFTALYTRR